MAVINGKDENEEIIYIEDYIAQDVQDIVDATKKYMTGKLSEQEFQDAIDAREVSILRFIHDR